MEAATLIRTGSTGLSLSRRNSFSGDATFPFSPTISLRFTRKSNAIRRALSESDVFQSPNRLSSAGPPKFPVSIPEKDDNGSLENANQAGFWPDVGIPIKKFGSSGDRSKIGDYYREMLKSSPEDSLLLRNYGKYLHEVEEDAAGAEEYYGRAILASPGDGEVLSLYGKLIWETRGDGERARAYFDQAVHVSPNDCTVLGSYAQFMWEADGEEEEMRVSQVSEN